MKASKQQHRARGRRRFAASKRLEPTNAPARPYGDSHPVLDIGNRLSLLEFYLPVIAGRTGVFPGPPLNFAQTADILLGEKRMLSRNPELLKTLDRYERLNNQSHPQRNTFELPHKLLREALAQCPESALRNYTVVQLALARLYSVAYNGRGPESTAAKNELAQLIPSRQGKGRTPDPITKHLPEIAAKFRELLRFILASNELMKAKFPRENERQAKLAELYDEDPTVIYAATHYKEKPFLAARLAAVLRIPVETAKKAIATPPAG